MLDERQVCVVNFKDIKFGFASAEKEGAFEPELILQGYYDHEGLIDEARSGAKFMFLGPKGTGKSSIAQRLKLEADADPTQFVKVVTLRDFPFKSFAQVAAGTADPESRYPSTWAWLIYLFLLNSFATDESRVSQNNFEFDRAVSGLTAAGYLPVDDLKALVIKSSKTSFKASLPTLIEAVSETTSQEGADQLFFRLVGHLKKTVEAFGSSSRHILVLDGLDDVLTQREVQYRSLAALVQEVNSINLDLMSARVPAKVVLLCRTDLFERLPDANKNKVRRDSAVVLDWYENTREPELSSLIRMADLRVQLSSGSENDGLLTLLPAGVDHQKTVAFLLDLTRHTPRDLLQLLQFVQDFAPVDGRPTREQMLNGARKYSIEYFLPEIQDELVGFLPQDHIAVLISLISATGKRTLLYSELQDLVEARDNRVPHDFNLSAALSALYECSAVGVIKSNRGNDTYSFKYRNRFSDFGMAQRLILHRGVWRALNLA